MDNNGNESLTVLAQHPTETDEPTTQLSQKRQPQDAETRLSKPKKSGRGWLIAMIVLFLAAIGGGVYYFMNQDSPRSSYVDDEDEEEDEDETEVGYTCCMSCSFL